MWDLITPKAKRALREIGARELVLRDSVAAKDLVRVDLAAAKEDLEAELADAGAKVNKVLAGLALVPVLAGLVLDGLVAVLPG